MWETLRNGDKLIEDLTKAIEPDPNDPRFYNQRAVAYDRFKNDLDRAIEDYTSALKVNDRFLFGYINRGQSYMKKRMYKEALKDAKEAVRLENRVPAAVILTASAYRENEDYENALKYYNMALELIPNWDRAYSERAVVWKELGEDEKAAPDLAKAIEVADSQDPQE